jgi:hypothetical protein
MNYVRLYCYFQAMESVNAAGWPTMKVEPLDPSQKGEIITGYLENIYGKTLSGEQKTLLVEAPQTNNPLYLRALLDEVRIGRISPNKQPPVSTRPTGRGKGGRNDKSYLQQSGAGTISVRDSEFLTTYTYKERTGTIFAIQISGL